MGIFIILRDIINHKNMLLSKSNDTEEQHRHLHPEMKLMKEHY